MKIERRKMYNESCNFCDRGELAKNRQPILVYPYEHITEVAGRSLSVRFCDDCFNELVKTKIKEPA